MLKFNKRLVSALRKSLFFHILPRQNRIKEIRMDNEYDFEKRERRTKKVSRVIGIIFTAALVVFICALLFRICQSDYKGLEDTYITDSFKAAYQNSTDVRTHAVNDTFSENGAVYAYSLVYIPESGYMQFTVRYNTRHIDEVIAAHPEFSFDKIRYTLTSKDGTTYEPVVVADESKYNYRYFKLEFTGVDFSSEELSVNMILDGLDFDGGSLVIHRSSETYIEYKFSKSEWASLN